jgi:D-alanine-D-alanine ligase
MTKKLKVAVLMGGETSEHEVSISSGNTVLQALDAAKYEKIPLVIAKSGEGYEKILELKPDVVFIALHGAGGEDGRIQGMLNLLKIPYLGAGVEASVIGMNKILFHKVMESDKIKTPEWMAIDPQTELSEVFARLSFPLVVKPACQGSSVGVSIVRSEDEVQEAFERAFALDRQALVEEHVSGVEVSCGILGNTDLVALPVVEISPKNEFFDYEAKYSQDKCEEIVPARISVEMTKKVQDLALKVYKAVGCRGFGRVDIIISNTDFYVLEINTIPGLTPASLLPKEAKAAGISYPELLDRIINLALEAHA